MESKAFDLIVLGGGPAGYPAAIRAAQLGLSVALVEAKELGGTCLNRGCIPSKALIAGAEFAQRLKVAPRFGISLPGWSIDYSILASHKDSVVEKMRKGVEGLVKANKITLYTGFGELISRTQIRVKGKDSLILEADKIILATGSEPREIAAFPFDHKKILDSTSLLALKEAPESLLIIGGGVIGCEFASLYANLGKRVTLIELLPRLLATEASEVAEAVTKAFEKKGIKMVTGVQVKSLESHEKGVKALTESESYSADCALVSVGRSLNTKGIGLEKVGVFVEENGLIKVNSRMESSVDGIYAAGDIASKWWLAHVATHQGIIAAENAAGLFSEMKYNAIPSVIFTHPEVGSVGLSLEQALENGYKAKKAPFPFQALGKAEAAIETDGFAQLIFDETRGEILGAQVVGFEASSLIAEISLAITNELTIESISETIHPHPTYSEIWGETAMMAEGFPLSLPPRPLKGG